VDADDAGMINHKELKRQPRLIEAFADKIPQRTRRCCVMHADISARLMVIASLVVNTRECPKYDRALNEQPPGGEADDDGK